MATKTNKQPDEKMSAGLALKDSAASLTIIDQEGYDTAAKFLTQIKNKMKEVEAAMDPSCKAAHNAWQVALNQKKQYLAPYIDAETTVKKSMANYVLEQRRIAEEAERKAREEALKQEEREREKLLKKAARAEVKGNEEDAETLREQAENVHVPVVAPAHVVAKADNVSTTNDVEITITDLSAFLPWLMSSGLDLASIITVKIQPIKQYVKLTKTKKVPGANVTDKITISAKSDI